MCPTFSRSGVAKAAVSMAPPRNHPSAVVLPFNDPEDAQLRGKRDEINPLSWTDPDCHPVGRLCRGLGADQLLARVLGKDSFLQQLPHVSQAFVRAQHAQSEVGIALE